MGWGKFDDAYPHHPKMLAAGADGLALDVAAVCYSNRYGTDGFIPEAMLPALFPPLKSPAKVARKLVDVGRWELTDGGWLIHDFGDYNPTAAEVEERRQKRAAAGRKGGQRSKPPSKREANASPVASDTDEAKRNPDPTPTSSHEDGAGADPPADGYLVDRTAVWLTDKGHTFGEYPSLHGMYEAVLKAAMAEVANGKRHGVAMGLVREFAERVEGGKLPKRHCDRLGKLLKGHMAEAVLYGVAQSMDWGAGLKAEYQDDADAWLNYVTAVVQKQEGK